MSSTNPDSKILSAKNISRLISVIGIMYLAPSLSSPLPTSPSTSDASMSVVIMKTIEKYFMKSTEMFTEENENGSEETEVGSSACMLDIVFINV